MLYLETDISFDLTIFMQPSITDRGTFNLPYVGLEPPTPGFELRASKIRGEDLTVALSQLNEIHNVRTTPLNISLISIYDEHQNFSKLMSVLSHHTRITKSNDSLLSLMSDDSSMH